MEALQKLAQSELTSLINYFYTNNLVPNATKTVYSVFYPRTPQQLNLLINNNPLDQESKAKLLGIMVQKDLKHNATILHIIKKLQPTIQSFRYANKFLPTHKMIGLYKSEVFPHFLYATTIWGSAQPNKTYLQPLYRTQKKIIRLIKNLSPRTHTKPLFAELKILNIYNIFRLRVCSEMHPFIYPLAELSRPDNVHNYSYASHIHEHKTRYATQRHIQIPNPFQYSRTRAPTHTMDPITREFAEQWNTIPVEIRQITSLTIFKQRLRHYLQETQDKE
jgi:hypothetical protein